MASMYEPDFDIDAYVRDVVATGRYDDERDVIRTALRLLHEQETIRAQQLAELIEPALAEADAGQTVPIEEVFATQGLASKTGASALTPQSEGRADRQGYRRSRNPEALS